MLSDVTRTARYKPLIRDNPVVRRLLSTDVGPHQENAEVHAQPPQRTVPISDPLLRGPETVVTSDDGRSAFGQRLAGFTTWSASSRGVSAERPEVRRRGRDPTIQVVGTVNVGHFSILRQWRLVARSVARQIRRDRVSVAASAFAYRWFLSLFPLIIALLGISSLVSLPHRTIVNLIHGVTSALPASAAQVLVTALNRAQENANASVWATSVAVVIALWSSLSGMVIVEEGLDMALGLSMDRSYLTRRAVAVPMLVSAVILGGAASALTVFGQPLGRLVRHVLPLQGVAFSFTWTAVRWVFALWLMNLLVATLYYVAPNRPRPRWRWSSLGTVIATVMWAAASLGVSFYTSSFGSFASTYGALAGVAILIFWLYLTGFAALTGAEIDAVVEKLRSQE
jgi:membrane protein